MPHVGRATATEFNGAALHGGLLTPAARSEGILTRMGRSRPAESRSAGNGDKDLFAVPLSRIDPSIDALTGREAQRQHAQLELIAPKNYLSHAVWQAHSSVFALTSVEGYPGKRMHAGTVYLDAVERLAIERAQAVFGSGYANVQPHSGTQANHAVLFAFLRPGDAILSLALSAGGHLSHGLRSNLSGSYYSVTQYGVHPETGLIDYTQAEELAHRVRPKLIITGGSSYPRIIDFPRLRRIADAVGALLVADIAHIAGLVAGREHPTPFPYAHIVTTTTNKNLRGPRGGLILAEAEHARALDKAVFPGIQGGPLPELICAKAVALGEAQHPDYRAYARGVLDNARTLAVVLSQRGYRVVTGGTDTPLVVVDLRPQRLTGDLAEATLAVAGITSNRNLVPADPEPPSRTSGIRFGTSAITTRGLTTEHTASLACWIADLLDGLTRSPHDNTTAERHIAPLVSSLAQQYPAPLCWMGNYTEPTAAVH